MCKPIEVAHLDFTDGLGVFESRTLYFGNFIVRLVAEGGLLFLFGGIGDEPEQLGRNLGIRRVWKEFFFSIVLGIGLLDV